MTTFKRNGYWRTSKHGTLHWVDDHSVSRNDWGRSGPLSPNPWRSRLAENRAGRSAAATFIIPNATCPICGTFVFFYQNENGSRVYFDDLGPPWPKHPCTDNDRYRSTKSLPSPPVEPATRSLDEVVQIRHWLEHAEINPQASFQSAYRNAAWPAYRIEWLYRLNGATLLILSALPIGETSRLAIRVESLPRHACVGRIIFFHRKRISYYDFATERALYFKISRVSNLPAFLNALCTPKG